MSFEKFRLRELPKPPNGLRAPGRRLWNLVQSQFVVEDAGGLAFLAVACRNEDDLSAMRKIVARDGYMVQGKNGEKMKHPLLIAIRSAETIQRQSLRALNMDGVIPAKVGRPGGKVNSK